MCLEKANKDMLCTMHGHTPEIIRNHFQVESNLYFAKIQMSWFTSVGQLVFRELVDTVPT